MSRIHIAAIALAMIAALAVSGCRHPYRDDGYGYDGGYGNGYSGYGYYDNYNTYRQVQWDRYGYDRQRMIERERAAAQYDRIRMERERQAWEKRETSRLNQENYLREQWQRERAQHEAQNTGRQQNNYQGHGDRDSRDSRDSRDHRGW